MNLGYENFGWFPSSCCISIETQWTTRVKMTGGRFSDPLHPSRSIASILIVIECALKRVLERENEGVRARRDSCISIPRLNIADDIFEKSRGQRFRPRLYCVLVQDDQTKQPLVYWLVTVMSWSTSRQPTSARLRPVLLKLLTFVENFFNFSR